MCKRSNLRLGPVSGLLGAGIWWPMIPAFRATFQAAYQRLTFPRLVEPMALNVVFKNFVYQHPIILKLHTLVFSLLAVGALTLFAIDPAAANVVPTTEVYGTAPDGTVLHRRLMPRQPPGPWPAVLIIHGGNFYGGGPSGSPESVTLAQDLAAVGYIAFSIEYRLAPPGSLPGQVSSGQFPDQTDDTKMAVRRSPRRFALQWAGGSGRRIGGRRACGLCRGNRNSRRRPD